MCFKRTRPGPRSVANRRCSATTGNDSYRRNEKSIVLCTLNKNYFQSIELIFVFFCFEGEIEMNVR